MKITNKNGLIILESDLGYMLYDEANDIYSQKIYLGKDASSDIYKEIKMEEIDQRVIDKTVELEETTIEQEEVIEVLMIALDELYQMFEKIFGI